MYETIIFEKQDGVCCITLNRPDRLNSLSTKMIAELNQALDEIEADDGIKAFVVTGAPRPDGRPCFCSGADLKEVAEGGLTRPEDIRPTTLGAVEGMLNPEEAPVNRLFRRVEMLSKPSIAAIDGVCTAGGIELALSCDFRIVSETAQISDLHVKNMGHIGGGGAAPRLAFLVGPAVAKELIFTCEPIDGREAFRVGFANHVYAPQEYVKGAMALGAKIATQNATAIRLGKAAINATRYMNFEECLRFSTLCWRATMDATGGFEGAKAFAEGRKPDFPEGR